MTTPRKPVVLILLSLCLAGLIAFSLLRQPEGHAAREATAVSAPVLRVLPSEKSPTVVQPNPTEKIEAFSWRRFNTVDYQQYITQLRSVGCPFDTICDIIIGNISRHYDSRLSVLRRSSGLYWKTSQRPSPTELEARRKRMQEVAALELERDTLIRDLLGIEFKDYIGRSSGKGDRWDEVLAFMPEWKPQVRPILSKYDELENGVIRASGGTLGAEDSATLKNLYRQKIEELKPLLKPSELEEYQLRSSPVADLLRNSVLVGFSPNQEEFRAIFRAYNSFDSSISGAAASEDEHTHSFQAIADRDEQIRQALGDQRFAEYVRSQDQTYQRLVELTDYYGLPMQAAIQVHNVREDVLAKIREVNQKTALPEDVRLATLQEIRKQTELEVIAHLGEDAFRQYSQAPWGVWIQDITR